MAETEDEYVQRRFRDKHPYENIQPPVPDPHNDRKLDFTGLQGGFGDYSTGTPVGIPANPEAGGNGNFGQFRARCVVIDPDSGTPTTGTKNFLTQ